MPICGLITSLPKSSFAPIPVPPFKIKTGLTFPSDADTLKSIVMGSSVSSSSPSIPMPKPKDRFSLNW